MLKLIQNEWMKLWAKKATWIIVALLVLIASVPAIFTKVSESKMDEVADWRAEYTETIVSYEEMIADAGEDEDVTWMAEEIAVMQYRLDKDIAPNDKETSEGYFDYGLSLVSLISFLTVIIAASIVSSEFSTGTIKMLLTRPKSRASILASKLLTSILFGLLLVVIAMITSFIVGNVVFDSGSTTLVQFKDGAVIETSIQSDMWKKFALSFGDFFLSILFAFMIGSVFRSSSLAITLTLILSFMGSLVVMFFSQYAFVKYIWLTHQDLTQHVTGYHVVEGFNLTFSIIVLAVYAIIFLAISFITFMKRDIKA